MSTPDKKAQVIFQTILAETILEIDNWHHRTLTAETFLERLQQISDAAFATDLKDLRSHALAVQSQIDEVIRSVDLFRNPDAPVRGTVH